MKTNHLQSSLVYNSDTNPSLVRRVISSTSLRENVVKNLSRCSTEDYRFECLSCGNVDRYPFWCGIRICNKCERKRRRRLYAKYGPLLDSFHGGIGTKFFTVTSDNHVSLIKPEKKRLDRLCELYFRRIERDKSLRRTAEKKMHTRIFGKLVKGGIRTMEIVEENGLCYLHYHMIIDSVYLDQARLSEIWLDVTRSSYVVDIRPCRGKKMLMNYLFSYVTKQVKLSSNVIDFYVKNLHKTRLFTVFGAFYGYKSPRAPSSMVCSLCGSGSLAFIGIWRSQGADSSVHTASSYPPDGLDSSFSLYDSLKSGQRELSSLTDSEIERLSKMGYIMETSPGVFMVIE